ncbi:hypothetical protein GN956_G2643 [Arapaima gigas]
MLRTAGFGFASSLRSAASNGCSKAETFGQKVALEMPLMECRKHDVGKFCLVLWARHKDYCGRLVAALLK